MPCPIARIALPEQAFTGRQARAETKLGALRTWGSSEGMLPELRVLWLRVVVLGVVARDSWEGWGTAAPDLHKVKKSVAGMMQGD